MAERWSRESPRWLYGWPQDRQGRFRTEVFERYQRSEKGLVAAMMEMYLQGASTRKVKTVTEELCGHEFSSSTISRIVQQLDAELDKFARRRLEEPYPYLILDARYEKVREDGAQAVLTRSVLTGKDAGTCWRIEKLPRAGRNCGPQL